MSMATMTKAEASKELKAAAVKLEAKIQNMFGPLPPKEEKEDMLMPISKASQQMFQTKLNSRPHPPPVVEVVKQVEEEKPPAEKWSARRSQLLAARQQFSDSRRRPLSCTPPSTSTSIDEDDTGTTSGSSSHATAPPVTVIPESPETLPSDKILNIDKEDQSSQDDSFLPKTMSSPDFLKTYRSTKDWPELEEESDEDSQPEDDIIPPDVKLSSSRSSSSSSRRKRYDTDRI